MSGSPDAREDLLRRLALGEVSAEDAEVQRAAAIDPDLARAVDDTRAVLTHLDRAAARARETIEGARRRVGSPGHEAVAPFVHSRVGTGRAGTRRWWIAGLGLAAALVLVFTLPWGGESRRNGWDPPLGASDLRALRPIGDVAAFDSFEWEAGVALRVPGSWFLVRVRDVESGERFTSPTLTDTTWRPSQAIDARQIEWWVEWNDGTGEARSWEPSRARRWP